LECLDSGKILIVDASFWELHALFYLRETSASTVKINGLRQVPSNLVKKSRKHVWSSTIRMCAVAFSFIISVVNSLEKESAGYNHDFVQPLLPALLFDSWLLSTMAICCDAFLRDAKIHFPPYSAY
jgi:hypothetical protein